MALLSRRDFSFTCNRSAYTTSFHRRTFRA
nr:MAG TPA: hypothetical protein [Caudoviricetes sp.]